MYQKQTCGYLYKMCPRPPKMVSLTNIQLLPKLVTSHTLDLKYQKKMEGLMIRLNHHKVHNNLFIIKGGIEVANCSFGATLDMRR